MNHWPIKQLSDLVSLEYGKALKAEARSPGGRFPVFGSNGIVGAFDKALVKEPTIVVGRKGAVGEAHLAENGCWPIDTAFYTVLREPNVISLRYLLLWFRSVDLKSLAITSTIPGLNRNTLYSQPVPVPPLAEQERIVKLLDEADELRKLRAQADHRITELIPALFHEMFGGRKFKPIRLGELTSLVTSGVTPRGGDEVYVNEGPYFIRSQNVQMNRLDLSDVACLPVEIHEQMSRTKIAAGDVLLNITGASIGRVAWVDKLDREANVSQHVCLIRPKRDLLNSAYLSVFISLQSTQFFILQIQSGASRQALNHQQVRTLEIPLPPIALQNEFATRVAEIGAVQSEQTASRRRLDDLFQSTLHRAFQGEL
jgi:type I restriction enzyme S subunit